MDIGMEGSKSELDEDNDEISVETLQNITSSYSNLELNSAPAKGYGLKKWRRIRRKMDKDVGGGVDSSLILKRRLSLNESPKNRNDNKVQNDVAGELETYTPSVGSLRSVEAVDEAVPLDPELVVAGARFSIGMDSDNSEDRGSKLSTGASSFKPRHEIGFGKERGRTKKGGGRGSSNSVNHRSQRGRSSGVDTSKKIRGDRVRVEKENSQSSVESDLRSSSGGCVRWRRGGSNGRMSEMSLSFNGEHDDEAQESDEDGSCCYKANNGVIEDLLRETMDPDLLREEIKVKRQNFHPPTGIDPFIESIVMLQAAREALETEIQKISEIGKATEIDDLRDFDDQSEEAEVIGSPTPQAHLLESKEKIEYLQNKLEEALAAVKAKDLEVLELEDIIKITQSPKDSQRANSPSFPVDEHNLECELEDLLKKKIQAEVEFFILTRTSQSWKVLAEEQTALLDKQKAIELREQAEKLGLKCRELSGTEVVLNLQNKVCKLSFCCSVQLLLLCAALALLLMRLMPPSDEIVPT